MGTATGLQAPVLGSALALPGAHGAAVARGLQGVEIAAFDALNYPFWYAAADFVHTQIQPVLPLWARMDSAPTEQSDLLQHLQWNEAHNNDGGGAEQNYQQAAHWYRLAAEQGDAWAQYNLGWAYYNGDGVARSFSEAVKWQRKAALQGIAEAQQALDYMNAQ